MGISLLLCLSTAYAQTIHFVKWDAAGLNDGSTWTDAYTSLQPALDAASEGDQIWVARGTYLPEQAPDPTSTNIRDRTFVLKQGVKLFGGFQGNEPTGTGLHSRNFVAYETILNGKLNDTDYAYHVVVAAGELDGTELDGFTVTQGRANGTGYTTVNSFRIDQNGGGGVYIRGNGLALRYVNISENMASMGAGIYNDGSAFSLYYSRVVANQSSANGGGIYNYSASPQFVNCHITNNLSSGRGGGVYSIYSGVPKFANTLIYFNSAAEGGGLAAIGSNPTLINVTVADNGTFGSGGSALYLENGAQPIVTNSIVHSNGTATNSLLADGSDSYATFSYSLVEGAGGSASWNGDFGMDGGNNIDGDPLFVDMAGDDLRIAAGSAAIDAGDNRRVPDYGGRQLHAHDVPRYETTHEIARISGMQVDMGAYEYQHPFALSPDANGILYVDETPSPTSNFTGDSWENAYPSLGFALNDAPPSVAEIWVAAGTYKPTHYLSGAYSDPEFPTTAFLLKPNLRLIGGFSGDEPADYDLSLRNFTENETILSGDRYVLGHHEDDNYHVVVAAGDVGDAAVDGFTIMHGHSRHGGIEDVGGAGVPLNKGGGMSIVDSSPTLVNLTFKENRSIGSGGALYISNGSPTITRCIFSSNQTAASGGAVALENGSQPEFALCEFGMNEAGANGGAMASLNSTPTIRQSLFATNEAVGTGADDGYGGGVYITGYTGVDKPLEYNHFSNNSAKMGGAIALVTTADVRILNTKITGNYAEKSGGGIVGINSRSLDMVNVEITKNRAMENGGAVYGDDLTGCAFFNTTIADNAAASANALYALNGAHLQLLNTIISDGADGIYRDEATGATIMYFTSTIEGSGGTDSWNDAIGERIGDILDADPLFTDRTAGNYTLAAGSPSINKGYGPYYTVNAAGPDVDLLGNPRFADAVIDMGAYERQRRKQYLQIAPEYVLGSSLVTTYGEPGFSPAIAVDADGLPTGNTVHYHIDPSVDVATITPEGLIRSLRSGEGVVTISIEGDPEAEVDGFDPMDSDFSFIVLKRNLTIYVNPIVKYYGQALDAETTVFSTIGLANSDEVTQITVTSAGLAADASVPGSPYAAVLSGALGTNLDSYNITYATDGIVTVYKADVWITALDVTKQYDGVPFAGGDGIRVQGLLNGEDESVLDVSRLSYSGDAQGATDVGTYSLIPQGVNAANYNINYQTVGTLTIEKANITGIDFIDETFVYDGSEKLLALSGTLPHGTSVSYTNNGRTAVGDQVVTAEIDGGRNYNSSTRQATLTILPPEITGITFEDASFMYDGSEKKLAITGSLPEGFTVSYSNNGRTDAGSQEVTAHFNGPGVVDLLMTASLTIEKATLTAITFDDRTYTYDGSEKTMFLTGSLPTGVSVVYTGNTRRDAGTQTAAATIDGGTNYENQELTATLTIEKATITGITFGDATFIYDGTVHSIGISGTLPPGAIVNYDGNMRTETGSQVATAAIEGGTNYENLTLTATITVSLQLDYEVTFNDGSFVYDGAEKTLTVSGTLPPGTSVNYLDNGRTDAGSQTVTASISGATGYRDLILTATLTIAKAVRSIDFPSLPEMTYGDEPHTIQATASSGEDIAWSSSDESVAHVEDGKLAIVGAGGATITASVPENPNYSNTPEVSQRLTVVKATQTVTLHAPATVNRDAGTITLDVSASSGLPVALSVDDSFVARLMVADQLEILRLGTVRVTATQPGDANHEAAEPVAATIRVIDPTSDLPVRVHPVVSPNGDGINDFLIIEGIKDYADNRFYIVSKNGTEVAEIFGYDNEHARFNGTGSGGSRLPAGTYYYVLELREGGQWKYKKGYFILRY